MMKKALLMLVSFILVFSVVGVLANEIDIIFDDPEFSTLSAVNYHLEGEIPNSIKLVSVNENSAEIFTKFRVEIPLLEAPSYSSANIVIQNETGEDIEDYILQIENKHELTIKIWIDAPDMEVDGENIQLTRPAGVINGRTLVPFRSIADVLGAEVEWHAVTRSIVMRIDGSYIEFTIDSMTADVNGETINLDAASTIIEGCTMVPLRLIAVAFDAQLDWLPDEKAVLLKRAVSPNIDNKTSKLENSGKLTFDDSSPSVLEGSSYTIEGEIPDGAAVFVNGKEAEIFKKFRIQIPLKGEPSFTPVYIEVTDTEGSTTELPKKYIENVLENRIKFWIDQPKMLLNGRITELNTSPHVVDGVTMIPVRPIADAFWAEMSWIGTTNTFIMEYGETRVEIQIGSTTAVSNGQQIELDAPAQVINETTMLPLRFVAEAFGSEITWIPEEKAIEIITKVHP